MTAENKDILQVRDLQVQTRESSSSSSLIHKLNFGIKKGEVLGLVGESGCGKTVTSLAILQLLNKQNMHVSGSVKLYDKELIGLKERQIRKIRGKDIAFITQNPMNAFTPVFTIGHQIIETIQTHTGISKKHAIELAVGVMASINLPEPATLLKQYPFQLSGGMLQRVIIAMAACLQPAVIIADEPTTALDLHSQFLVLRLLEDIRSTYGTSILLISHDLGVISEMADQVIVMQNGQIIESADVLQLFDHPQHEYTKKLLRTRPSLYSKKQPYPYLQ